MINWKKLSHNVKQAYKPLLQRNEVKYNEFNRYSLSLIQKFSKKYKFSSFVTANNITTGRTFLGVPMIFLLSTQHTSLAAFLLVTNLSLDYVDGAWARFEKKSFEEKINSEAEKAEQIKKEVFGAYYDAIADKIVIIPVWFYMFFESSDSFFFQSLLLAHVLVESQSLFIRTKEYAIQSNTPSKTNTVRANMSGKTKQALATSGTIFLLLPFDYTNSFGTLLLASALPLSLISLQEKLK